jgi:hypothetical protein
MLIQGLGTVLTVLAKIYLAFDDPILSLQDSEKVLVSHSLLRIS